MNYIFHIGYHKTGTTFLQNNVFPNIKGVSNIPRFACQDVLNGLINYDEFNIAKTKMLIQPYAKSQTILISYEPLVGQPFYYDKNEAFRIADRISEFDNVKVLISLRNQISLIDSLYRQYIQQGGAVKFSSFFNPNNRIFDKNYCNYYELITRYKDKLGKGNLLILTQEELHSNQEYMISRLLSLLNRDKNDLDYINQGHANISMTNFSINIMRYLNRFTSSNINSVEKKGIIRSATLRKWLQHRLDPMIFSKISNRNSYLRADEREEVMNYYAKSNKKLDLEYSLSLKELNYY